MRKKIENILVGILLIIIIVLVIWYFVNLIKNGVSELEGGLFVLISPVLMLILIRIWIIRLIKKLMRKESGKTESGLPQELNIPEKKAASLPVFFNFDKTINTNEATASREKFVSIAYKLFRKKYFFGFLACAGYIILPYLFSIVSGKSENNMSISYIFSFNYFFYISIQFLIFRKQFKPGNYQFGKYHQESGFVRFMKIIPYGRLLFPALKILKEIFHPRYGAIALVMLILLIILSGLIEFLPGMTDNTDPEISFSQNPWRGIGVFLAIPLHVFLTYRLLKLSRQYPNNSLLILRVFGNNEKVELTFGRLARFWQHFGTWFTIVDPSFLSPRFRFFRLRTLLEMLYIFILQTLASLFITWIGSYLNLKIEIPVWLNITLSSFIGYAVYILYWRRSVIRGFAKDTNAIRKKMNKVLKQPRRFDLTFKNLPLFCYDNTWRHAVNEFIKKSKVVLMDLRGFSVERKGCEYEIDFLFDTVPINRILFLVDNDTDQQFIYQTILQRWEFLRVNSPNLHIIDPVAKIFICNPEEDQSDVQKMMDLLIDASCESS